MEATSLYTLIQMVEGGMGVTLLPEITLKAGLLKGTRLIARPFAGKPGAFVRTPRRRDYAMPPPGKTILEVLAEAGIPVTILERGKPVQPRRADLAVKIREIFDASGGTYAPSTIRPS